MKDSYIQSMYEKLLVINYLKKKEWPSKYHLDENLKPFLCHCGFHDKLLA